MSMPAPSWHDSKVMYLVVGVVIGIVVGLLLAVALQPGSGSGGTTSPSPRPSVYSSAWTVSADPSTLTPSLKVLAGSAVFVFVGFVNSEIGGGSIAGVTDSLGDTYALVASSGYSENHTENLYVAEPSVSTSTFSVIVTFYAGDTPMGGSVGVVDVAGSGTPTIDGVNWENGVGGIASVTVPTNHSGDLVLLGVSGQWKDEPFAPVTGETLLDTGGNTSGPFEDGESIGTFWSNETGSTALLSATLANAAVWNAVGVGILDTAT